jgi:hypothetical protein
LTGIKYGQALDRLFPGRDRDKRIAQMFGISARMANHLRAGNHWTLDRLAQATELLGDAWEAALRQPDSEYKYNLEKQDLERRVARLEEYVGRMDKLVFASLSPTPGRAGDMESGGYSDGGFGPSDPAELDENKGAAR